MNTLPNADYIGAMLRGAVQRRLEEIIEEEAKAAQERVTRRCKEVLPQILCTVNDRFSMERFGTDLRITIRMEDNQSKSKPEMNRG